MLIVGAKTGQLGNRILLFAHLIANAAEYGYRLANPAFCEYAPFFEATRQDFFCRYPPAAADVFGNPTRLRRAFYKVVRGLAALLARLPRNPVVRVLDTRSRSEDLDLASPAYLEQVRSTRYLLTLGARFRDHRNLWKHGGELRAYFTPAGHHRQAVDSLIEAARRDGSLLAGVHIRRGDYRRWLDGKYYFNLADYANAMRRFASLIPGRVVKFLICSNTVQDDTPFQGLSVVRGTGQMVEDMYALARCDYIIGPPSTFTGWASFYGQVPLYRMRERDAEFDLQSFGIYGDRRTAAE